MIIIKRSTITRPDDEQPESVNEHFDVIMADNTFIDTKYAKVTPDDLPDWFNEDLFKRGQRYYTRNILGIGSAYLAGLIAVFLVPSIAKILAFTRQSSTPCTAFKRYFQTLIHLYNLQTCDFRDPKSKFYTSINVIRWKHATVSARSVQRKQQGISQRDMVLTQFGFVGYVLVNPEVVALTNELEERQGFNHFWRVIGHLLGIPDRMNLCRRNEYETTLLCNKLLDEIYRKNLKEPNEEFFTLTKCAVDGLQSVDPLIDIDAFLCFFYEINDSKYGKEISLYSRLNYMYKKTIFYLIGTPIIGSILRSGWNVYLGTMYWIYENYPVIAWMKYGKKQSKIHLYPHSSL